jgi:hypothetical protein
MKKNASMANVNQAERGYRPFTALRAESSEPARQRPPRSAPAHALASVSTRRCAKLRWYEKEYQLAAR